MKYTSLLKKILVAAFMICISNNTFSQLTLAVGNLNPGDSIVIYYDVSINAGAGNKVANQGLITGANFANLVTDDPKTPGTPNDSTFTFLNIYPLPVTLYELKAASKNSGILVTWNVSFENSMQKYEVEKSTDGRLFSKIGEVAARNVQSNTTYTFLDQNPNSGINFYRLHLIDQSTSVKYSMIIRVDMDGKNNGIRIYPNPVVQQTITLQLSNIDKGNYEMIIYNSIGQVAYKQMIIHDGGSASKNILLPGTLSKGFYNVLIKTDKQTFNQSIIIK